MLPRSVRVVTAADATAADLNADMPLLGTPLLPKLAPGCMAMLCLCETMGCPSR